MKSVCGNRKCTDEKDSETTRSKSREGNEREQRSPMAGSGGVSGNERPSQGASGRRGGGFT